MITWKFFKSGPLRLGKTDPVILESSRSKLKFTLWYKNA